MNQKDLIKDKEDDITVALTEDRMDTQEEMETTEDQMNTELYQTSYVHPFVQTGELLGIQVACTNGSPREEGVDINIRHDKIQITIFGQDEDITKVTDNYYYTYKVILDMNNDNADLWWKDAKLSLEDEILKFRFGN